MAYNLSLSRTHRGSSVNVIVARAARRACLLALASVVCGCTDSGDTTLGDIREHGRLEVLTRNAPTTYYEGRDGPDGFEYALTQSLAQALKVKVDYRIYDTVEEILAAIKSGEGHLAAAGLTRTETREKEYRFGPDYKTIRQQVVCHRDGPRPKSIQDLPSVSLLVIAASSYVDRLVELKPGIPELEWNITSEHDTEQLLERVWKKELDCTVADSNIVEINRRYFPELTVAFPLSEEQSLAWVLPKQAEKLQSAIEEWFNEVHADGFAEALDERFYGHVDKFDFVDITIYRKRIDERLPRYRKLFHRAEEEFGFPWTLLAAQSYQESHWNPKAKSATGVRGMMMLTKRTAKELDVKNRMDPQQSILGGAKYLSRIIERLPEEIPRPDRLWFALAAYNIGMGHIWDARTLAERLGKDPNTWVDMQTVLPLLSQRTYYRTLKHGYARGTEPVRYVQRIREYHDILERHGDT